MSPAAAPADAFDAIEAGWRPPPVTVTEAVTATPAEALAGLFDVDPPGDELPPLWHWLYLLDRPAQAELGEDGHARDGLLVPPLAERRRMFGGGRLTVQAPVRVGEVLTRRSSVTSVRARTGGSGRLLLVTVRHELSAGGQARAVEEQDIVYRAPAPPAPAPAGGDGEPPGDLGPAGGGGWSFTLRPDPPLLFRFSALTYNAHRIHYDHPYATGVEGYPGLVVHGPLLALALLELPRRFAPEVSVRAFTWRARRPLFAGEDVAVSGRPGGGGAELTAGRPGAAPAVAGSVTWER